MQYHTQTWYICIHQWSLGKFSDLCFRFIWHFLTKPYIFAPWAKTGKGRQCEVLKDAKNIWPSLVFSNNYTLKLKPKSHPSMTLAYHGDVKGLVDIMLLNCLAVHSQIIMLQRIWVWIFSFTIGHIFNNDWVIDYQVPKSHWKSHGRLFMVDHNLLKKVQKCIQKSLFLFSPMLP